MLTFALARRKRQVRRTGKRINRDIGQCLDEARMVAERVAIKKGEVPYGDWKNSRTHQRIRGDGFYETKADLSKHAWQAINSTGRVVF